MRNWGAAILLGLAACQQAEKPPAKPPEISFDGAKVASAVALRAHGERLTHVLGCTGCHGAHLEGTLLTKDHPEWGPLYASNLTAEVPEYTDSQLDSIIRHGAHPKRKTVWGMPSHVFHNLGDTDFRALVAFLRSLEPVGGKLPPPHFSAQDRKDIAAGIYQPATQMVQESERKQPLAVGPQYQLGRYIASTTCEECHGSDLGGDPLSKTPNLVVASGYSRVQFETLITTGVPVGGRKLNPMMSGVAKTRFNHLTPHERDALYAYLKARADRLSR